MQWGIKVVTHAAKLIEYKYFIRLKYSQSNEFIKKGNRVQLQALIKIFFLIFAYGFLFFVIKKYF